MTDQVMIEVQHGEETIQVPLPEGILRATDVATDYMPKSTFASELGRRALSIAKDKGYLKPEDMLSNEEHVAAIMEQHGLVKKTVDGDPAKPTPPTPEMLADLQTSWRTKELVPVQEALQLGENRVTKLLGRMRASDIVAAAAASGVKERFLKPAAVGQDAPIVSMLGSIFRFDEEHGEYFVAKDAEHFEITSDTKAAFPYKTITEFITGWAGQPENKDFVDVAAQSGAGLNDIPGSKSSGKDIVITREAAANFQEYQKAQVEAEKRGGSVIVEGTPIYGAVHGGVA